MIIAGFSGIGKSTFCRETDNAFDLECMPYKYSNLDSLLASGRSIEEPKAGLKLDLVRGWETLYLEAVLSLRRDKCGIHMEMNSSEYLPDLKSRLDGLPGAW